MRNKKNITVVCLALSLGARLTVQAATPVRQDGLAAPSSVAPTIDQARHLFYSGRYSEASAMALALRERSPEDLATFELRTSAIHFQIRRAIGEPEDKDKAFKACAECADLMHLFTEDTTRGRTLARARVERDPKDTEALFFLGKIDLNYVWLQLATLGHRTGWNEYREARRSLDDVLRIQSTHTRARVARAWIDYIVDTKVSWGFRWILGGGDKKKALVVMHDAAANTSDHFERTEAAFGLWEMSIREKNIGEALQIARGLVKEFPDNRELAKFIATRADAAPSSIKK